MLNRILISFSNESEAEYLLKYGKMLEEKYDVEVCGIYVKDIRKYEIIPSAVEGMLVDTSTNYVIEEWSKIEEKTSQKIRKNFLEVFPKNKFYDEDGVVTEIVLDKLRGFDLFIISKTRKLNSDLKAFLRLHYKPMIMVPEMETYSLENVLIANDGIERANKSFFHFMDKFNGAKNYTLVSLKSTQHYEELKNYLSRAKLSVEFLEKSDETAMGILEEISGKDILVMGDLKYYCMIEKLTGKIGVHLIEESNIPVFIG